MVRKSADLPFMRGAVNSIFLFFITLYRGAHSPNLRYTITFHAVLRVDSISFCHLLTNSTINSRNFQENIVIFTTKFSSLHLLRVSNFYINIFIHLL